MLARAAFKKVILEGKGGWGKGGAGRSAWGWQEESMQIAVIGAGISGLVCARKLAEAGHRVVVLEKSRSLGVGVPQESLGSIWLIPEPNISR